MTEILERVATGDEGAVKECVATYGDLVWSLALRLLKDRGEAEDAVQEVFVELWRSAGRFDAAVASERTFVMMVARRRLYDRLRRADRAPTTAVPAEELERLCAPQPPAAETHTEARLAASALARLGEDEREVLVLASYYGHSHQEIADRLGLPLGTVKTRARRAMLRVRGWLRTEEVIR